MSNNRLRFIRGHVDALRELCGEMRQDSMPVKAVDLLKSKVDEAAMSRDTGAYYMAGYEVTRSVASWIELMIKSTAHNERSNTRTERNTSPAVMKSKARSRRRDRNP